MAEKSAAQERKITAYPSPKNHKDLMEVAAQYGGVSKVINQALKCFFESKGPLDNMHDSTVKK